METSPTIHKFKVGCFTGDRTRGVRFIGYGYTRASVLTNGLFHIFEGHFKHEIRGSTNTFEDESEKFAFEQRDETEGNRVIETKIEKKFVGEYRRGFIVKNTIEEQIFVYDADPDDW